MRELSEYESNHRQRGTVGRADKQPCDSELGRGPGEWRRYAGQGSSSMSIIYDL